MGVLVPCTLAHSLATVLVGTSTSVSLRMMDLQCTHSVRVIALVFRVISISIDWMVS